MRVLDDSFGRSLSILSRAATAYFQRELKPFGIGPGQQAYLLSILPGEILILDELARRMAVDNANVTRAVKALESSGYLEKRPSEIDRRAWNITLTEEGAAVREKVEETAKQWVSGIRSAIDDDSWHTTVKTLDAIADSLT
ncbi:MarR family winged helix-turn-helix transcriptional regulator [Spirochaeta isovalerica]|uniref:DNA-binding MarR family transcriptional regulator n=1 Tax=Spirochaeta isovalerica TaxID=150 RepID=A0A841RAN5_9SPIO|nr:MarR family transcriptional regulator [Spirochaeta isovalerica]MBB6480421.1 DNA-binding MarR family transcriptional regulator [Spirochaeta isovalerica]